MHATRFSLFTKSGLLYIIMPSFYLMSLFQRQKEKYCRRHAKAYQELGDFVESVETQVGKDVGGIFRTYIADIPWGFRLRGERLPEIPVEGQAVLDEFLRLNRQEAVVMWKIRHSAFSFHEPLTPPYVFWAYGLNWDDIELGRQGTAPPYTRFMELGPRRTRGLGADLPEEAEASRAALPDGVEAGGGSGLLDMTRDASCGFRVSSARPRNGRSGNSWVVLRIDRVLGVDHILRIDHVLNVVVHLLDIEHVLGRA